MLRSLQETKYDLLLLLLLPLLLPTQMKIKQQQQEQITQFRVASKRDKLHFSDLQYIYICKYVSYTYASVN